MTAEIHASVAVHAFGECYGASHGGVLEQEVHELPVSCRPDALPDMIKVDVTKLQVGDVLTVGQLVLPEGVKVRGLADEDIVFHVVLPTQDVAAAEGAAEPEAINEKKAEARAAEKAKK
jgi:large subunit ribosomal protein L25